MDVTYRMLFCGTWVFVMCLAAWMTLLPGQHNWRTMPQTCVAEWLIAAALFWLFAAPDPDAGKKERCTGPRLRVLQGSFRGALS